MYINNNTREELVIKAVLDGVRNNPVFSAAVSDIQAREAAYDTVEAVHQRLLRVEESANQAPHQEVVSKEITTPAVKAASAMLAEESWEGYDEDWNEDWTEVYWAGNRSGKGKGQPYGWGKKDGKKGGKKGKKGDKQGRGKKGNSGGQASSYFDGYCHHCWKYGHSKKNCWSNPDNKTGGGGNSGADKKKGDDKKKDSGKGKKKNF